MTRFFAALLFLLCPITAQAPISATPGQLGDTAGAWVYFDDGAAEFRDLTGNVLSSITSSPDGDEWVTSWPDRGNPKVIHEVRTSHGGKTVGARKASLERHKESVELMQEEFPPVKPE